jgi:hypothetical protein
MTADRLFNLPPNLTQRQQTALNTITAAGWDGVTTDELGAAVHAAQGKHAADELCAFCGSAGRELGTRLRALGYVQQRRRGEPGRFFYVWTVAGKLARPDARTHDWIPF